MKPEYWLHFVEDQPVYPEGTDVFWLLDSAGQRIVSWLPGEHVPCWLDFLPNRDAAAPYTLEREARGEKIALRPGNLRQRIRESMWSITP